jgi:hypothetical protein
MMMLRMMYVLGMGLVLLMATPARGNQTGAGTGTSMAETLGTQFLADLASFTQLTNQVLGMLERGESLIEQGQTIIDGLTGVDEVPDTDRDLTLGTMCLSHPACTACAQAHVDRANRAYEGLEKNRALYVNTMRKYAMYDAAARGAASGHQAAGAALAIQRARSIDPAQRKFEANLTSNQTGWLNVLGTNLQAIGACEIEHLGVNTFQGISRNTLELMRLKYTP